MKEEERENKEKKWRKRRREERRKEMRHFNTTFEFSDCPVYIHCDISLTVISRIRM